MKKIAVVDPSSYSLPYDSSYIESMSEKAEVDFFCSYGANFSDFNEKLHANSHNLYVYKVSPSSSGHVVFGIFSYIQMLFKLYLKRKEYDFIHFQWSIFFPLEVIFFIFLRGRVVFTIHNDIPHGFKRKKKLGYMILSFFSKKNVFVSNFTKERFEFNYFKSNKNILVQHGLMYLNNLNVLIFDRHRKEYDVIFWGRVEDYKGVDVFLRPELNGLKLGIFGRWGKKLLPLKEKIDAQDNCSIYDSYIDEKKLSNLFSQRSIYILPYKAATQSGVLYTLLAYRVVFIASSVGENAEFLKGHGLEKLIFERDKAGDILRAFHYAEENYDEIVRSLDVISEEYEWNKILDFEAVKNLYS